MLLVSTNYAPEHAGIGPYATQIAEHWADLGHETHVLAGMPHYPAWSLEPEYKGRSSARNSARVSPCTGVRTPCRRARPP